MMNGEAQSYKISVHELKDEPGVLAFAFVAKGDTKDRQELPKKTLQFLVLARGSGEEITFDWSRTPDDPADARGKLENEVRRRVDVRQSWIAKVQDLVHQVDRWGRELGWSTRQIDKKLDDPDIGDHRVPALLMQDETVRILLEPIGRSSSGTEGIVDLYLMPAYDDIARLFFEDGRWNVRHDFPDRPILGDSRELVDVPLSKETLQAVLDEMRIHAA